MPTQAHTPGMLTAIRRGLRVYKDSNKLGLDVLQRMADDYAAGGALPGSPLLDAARAVLSEVS